MAFQYPLPDWAIVGQLVRRIRPEELWGMEGNSVGEITKIHAAAIGIKWPEYSTSILHYQGDHPYEKFLEPALDPIDTLIETLND